MAVSSPEFTVKSATTPENVEYIITYFDDLIPRELNMGFEDYVTCIGNLLGLSEKLTRSPIKNPGRLYQGIKWGEQQQYEVIPRMSSDQFKDMVFSNLREMKNDPSQKEPLEGIKLILTTYSKLLPQISELLNKIEDLYKQSDTHTENSWRSSTKSRRKKRRANMGVLIIYMKRLIQLEPTFNESIDEIYSEIFPDVAFRPDKATVLELANKDNSNLPKDMLRKIAGLLGGGRMYKKRRITCKRGIK